MVYHFRREQHEKTTDVLDRAYYHAGDVNCAKQLEQWLADGGMIVARLALGTGVDFAGIV
jgi:hypothetical protein